MPYSCSLHLQLLGNRIGLLVKARVGFGSQPEGPGFESPSMPFLVEIFNDFEKRSIFIWES